mmetsp:Transcript_72853/g.170608  ORF Transcript_72853/g.170608 Transcript_72853/m.170608 type:complete len:235 (-) Transcript_72853:1120-1824(-)
MAPISSWSMASACWSRCLGPSSTSPACEAELSKIIIDVWTGRGKPIFTGWLCFWRSISSLFCSSSALRLSASAASSSKGAWLSSCSSIKSGMEISTSFIGAGKFPNAACICMRWLAFLIRSGICSSSSSWFSAKPSRSPFAANPPEPGVAPPGPGVCPRSGFGVRPAVARRPGVCASGFGVPEGVAPGVAPGVMPPSMPATSSRGVTPACTCASSRTGSGRLGVRTGVAPGVSP